ncbi:MAG: endonuclease/exonuclease/phosphatase family protein [Muribaculaceae bacterium]|nr:endonuclease/exonuclease/phosphatase family protein [Muribaculaceae bacterium]
MKSLIKLILLIVNIAGAIVLLISAYGGHINPQLSSLPGIALMMLPLVALIMVALLLVDLLLWRRLAFMPAFAILICAAPLWNLSPLNISITKPQHGDRELKVMTYNVCNFNYNHQSYSGDINYNLSTIIKADADIVCLQEAAIGNLATWKTYRAQCDTLNQRYPYQITNEGQLTVWSRYPITGIKLVQPEDPTAFFQCVNIEIENFPITLYNVHLQSIGLSPEDKKLYGSITRRVTSRKLEKARDGFLSKLSHAMKERAGQAVLLREQIDSIGGQNILVTGDFNDIADCWSQREVMGKDLKSAFTTAGLGPTVTYYANRFYFNIDHVLYSNGFTPVKYQRIKSLASDHYPVLVTFAIPQAQ